MRKPHSIRQLLLLAFILAGLLPAMVVSFLSFYQAREALKQEIMRDMRTLSITIANNVERVMFERFQNVHLWSQLAIMQDIQIGDVDKRLAAFLSELAEGYGDMYHSIEVVNTEGAIVASSDSRFIGKTKKPSQIWFQVHISNKSLIVSKINNHTLAISQAIISTESSKVLGYLIVNFNWKIIQNLLNQSEQSSTSVQLTDENGHSLLASTNWPKIHTQHGMHATSHFNSSTMPNWQINIDKLHSVAAAPVHRLGYVFLALLIATLFFAAILVTPIAQAITHPLSQLTDYVRKYMLNKSASPPNTGPPEVQELGFAFEKLIQELDQSQAQLTRAAKLAVVGEMAAAMSHEIRTPLGILRSSANLLERESKLSKEGHEVVGFIISETERLNKLVSTLIDAARPRLPVMTTIDLSALIQRTMSLLATQAEAKKITLEFINKQQGVYMQADHDQMTQVLMNLLINAIQILPTHGKVQIILEINRGNFLLRVSDNGPGIAIENQAQIFEPFFTQRAGGVGLGLAVVRQIVQAHHGEIYYQTGLLGGAEFVMQFKHDT